MQITPKLYFSYESFHSQKVLLYFYEKGVQFDNYVIDSESGENYHSWYLHINPRGEVPSLVVEDKYILGSDEIIEYVEEHELGNTSLIVNVKKQSKITSIMNTLSELPIEALTFGTAYFPQYRTNDISPFSSKSYRDNMINKNDTFCEMLRRVSKKHAGTPAEAILLAKAIECNTRLINYGKVEEYTRILKQFISILDDVEDHLALDLSRHLDIVSDGNNDCHLRYINGKEFTDVDCLLAIVLNRLDWIGYSSFMGPERPSLSIWWQHMKQRPSFQKSTNIPLLNLQILRRKLYGNKFRLSAILGILAAFAFTYKYMNHGRSTKTVTKYIILEKLF